MITECTLEHIESLELQPAQEYMAGMLERGHAEYLLNNTTAHSIWSEDGKLLACVGFAYMWEGRAYVWMLVDKFAGQKMITIIRSLKRLMDLYDAPRWECIVDEGFDEGRRMLEILGYECETPVPMKRYGPTGKGAYQYAKVK